MDLTDGLSLTDGVITLRTPTIDDAQDVASAVLASIDHLMAYLPWATRAYDTEAATNWITGAYDPTAHTFLVLDPDGQLVGSAGLNRVDALNDKCDLGYWLRPDATGNGYATRATNLLIEYALEQVGMHRIEIYMSIENEPSTRVAERSISGYQGGRYEGIARGRLKYHGRYHDAHMFAVVAT